MNEFKCLGTPIYFKPVSKFNWKKAFQKRIPNKILIVVDENTHEHCLSHLLQAHEVFQNAEILELPAGESTKQLQYCEHIWIRLTELEFSREDMIISLGGGMISDITGFAAGTFKRGMRFASIPTSLLSMVDAAVGGKTGIDLGPFKNQIGSFNSPEFILIDEEFLLTLPVEEIRNGLAEMIKHGLIRDITHLAFIEENLFESKNLDESGIRQSVNIKVDIVQADPLEKGERKLLNFGHTVGHAIEGACMNTNPMDHGLAVVHGMLVESEISRRLKLIDQNEFNRIKKLCDLFPLRTFTEADIATWLELMKNDKKNSDGQIKMTLLKGIGHSIYDQVVPQQLIVDSMKLLTIQL